LLDFLGGKSSWLNANGDIIEYGKWHENGFWDPTIEGAPTGALDDDKIVCKEFENIVNDKYDTVLASETKLLRVYGYDN